MRFFFVLPFVLLACSSSSEPCGMCARQGFSVRVPSDTTSLSVTGCDARPDAVSLDAGRMVFVEVKSAGTCHVDLTLADRTHRSGDSQVTYADTRCCAGYRGPTVDLSK